MPPPKLGLALWGTEPAERLAAHARLAEELGFDSVWVIDSQLLCREVYTTLAVIATATTKIQFGPGVTQPVTRHASVTASAMATLQEISGGRAMLGMGLGFSSLGTIGIKPARIAVMERHIAEVRALLTGEPVAFENNVTGRMSWLLGPVPTPIHIGASGPKLTQAAGRIADGAIMLQGVDPAFVARAVAQVREGAGGRPVEMSCWTPVGLHADRDAALAQVRPRAAAAIKNANPDAFEGAERDFIRRLRAEYDTADHARARSPHSAAVPDSLIARYAVAGTPGEFRGQLEQLLAQPGLDRVILNPQVAGPGALPVDELLRGLARDVLPHVGFTPWH
ncbi:MAG: LLM class flavin-dependent oxidoreductase [Acetobacteraceae bacterium]|nr:LLM class flavin-dependent oxidoreductase [Acetobacteraceae bacterium]